MSSNASLAKLAATVTEITGTRFCYACMAHKPTDGGADGRDVKGKRRWRCACRHLQCKPKATTK